MNKGILIVNNPLTCAHCRFSDGYMGNDGKKVWYCILTQEDVELTDKSGSCPIIGDNEPIERLVYGISGKR